MRPIRSALALAVAALAPVALAQRADRAVVDSLYEVAYAASHYDGFLNATFGSDLVLPDGLPRADAVRAAYGEMLTPAYVRGRIRATFLRDHDADDLRTLIGFLSDPVVQRAIAQDHAGGRAAEPEDYDRMWAAFEDGSLDPRFRLACVRLSVAAGDGEPNLQAEIDKTIALLTFANPDLPAHLRVSRAEMEAYTSDYAEMHREDYATFFQTAMMVRFEGFPVADLEHYAEALGSPGGQLYIALVTTAPTEVFADALAEALRKA